MELPTQKTVAIKSLDKFTMLLFGQPKIGKSTLASHFPNTIFLATEPGHRYLEIWKIDINSWEDFLEAGAMLINEKGHKFQTIVIDTIDNLLKFCEDYVCKKFSIKHPSDLGYAKGWTLLKSEFHRALRTLVASGFNTIFISHQKETVITSQTVNFTKITNSLTASANKIITGMVDIIAYLGIEVVKDKNGDIVSEEHVLTTKTSPSLEVGARGSASYVFPSEIIIPNPATGNGYQAIVDAIKILNQTKTMKGGE